jgi:3-mercaptopyruvate sulfurtransferase SseA
MRTMVAIILALILGLSVTAAWAGDVAGKIQAVDPGERVIVLQDGTKLWIAEGLPIESLKEGDSVKASFEERDGKNLVITIEVE